jgi:hypothetical protein
MQKIQNKKFIVITTLLEKKYIGIGGIKDEEIQFLSIDELDFDPSIKPTTIEEAEQKVSEHRGFDPGISVLVHERIPTFGHLGTVIDFEATGKTNRPKLFEALDWYFSAMANNSLILPENYKNSRIPLEVVDPRTDPKGTKIYNIEWKTIQGIHYLILLSVLAVFMQPFDLSYTTSMLKQWIGPVKETNRIDRIINRLDNDLFGQI